MRMDGEWERTCQLTDVENEFRKNVDDVEWRHFVSRRLHTHTHPYAPRHSTHSTQVRGAATPGVHYTPRHSTQVRGAATPGAHYTPSRDQPAV